MALRIGLFVFENKLSATIAYSLINGIDSSEKLRIISTYKLQSGGFPGVIAVLGDTDCNPRISKE